MSPGHCPSTECEGRDPLLEGIATLIICVSYPDFTWREGRDPLLEGIATFINFQSIDRKMKYEGRDPLLEGIATQSRRLSLQR